MTPVAVCLIARDEQEHIETAISSVRPYVAEICVLDSGSTDQTLEILERMATEPGAPIRAEHFRGEFDFETARNLADAMASSEIKWRMWMDVDEEAIGTEHLSTLVGAADSSGLDCIQALRQTTVPDWPHWRERLTRRGTGRWEGYAHAMWRAHTPKPALYAHPAAFRVVNHRPMKRETWVELARRGAEHNLTGVFELAGELFQSGDVGNAIDLYKAYLDTARGRTCDRSYVNASRNLMNALRRLERHEEIGEVQADLSAFVKAFPWHLQVDALDTALQAVNALLRVPAGLAGPVFAIA